MRNNMEKTMLKGHNLNKNLKENKENGVTLVSLVVTIVILIILATISINSLIGENGLISAAQGAKEHQLNAIYEENKGLNDLYDRFDEVIEGTYTGSTETTILGSDLGITIDSEVGDTVSYDAGNWTTEDLENILKANGQVASIGDTTVTHVTGTPTAIGEIGGISVGDSKNANSATGHTSGDYGVPSESGWRIWSMKENANGTYDIEIVCAGHSETYFSWRIRDLEDQVNFLQNRDMSMYVNDYATSAKFMQWSDVKTFMETNGTNVPDGVWGYWKWDGSSEAWTTSYNAYFKTYLNGNTALEKLVNNNAWSLLACSLESISVSCLPHLNPRHDYVRAGSPDDSSAMGLRPIVSLKSIIL